MVKFIFCLFFGYLFGSLNFAIIYSKLRGDDIRNHGSGNAGATNVLRTYGKLPALIVFLLDISKGIVSILLVRVVFSSELLECAAALGAVLGHNFPVYYKFAGGKGVSTSFAVLLILHWEIAIISLAVFIITVLVSHYVSLSSILAALAALIFSVVFYNISAFSILCVIISILCILRHKENIKRLINGNENKLGHKRKD